MIRFLLVKWALLGGREDPPAALVVEEALRRLFPGVHLNNNNWFGSSSRMKVKSEFMLILNNGQLEVVVLHSKFPE